MSDNAVTHSSVALCVMSGFCLLIGAGCARLKPVQLIDQQVHVADRNVVIFFVDGVSRDVYRQMLDRGELPNIAKYLVLRGVSVTNAVTVAPSITYAATTSLATGLVPGHHGIVANKYFDRDRLTYTAYNTIKTYRDVDDDFNSATIFEMLHDKFSVTIQTPLRRGAYRNIDNWASSGIRWHFNQITEIDALTAERFVLIGQIARRAQRWPELIWAYMPATDEIGHRHGADSPKYRAALSNADEQIGRICATLEANGLLEKTYLIFVSDHGHVPCPTENYLNLADMITTQFGLTIATGGPDKRTRYSERAEYFQRFDAVLTNGGNRRANLHLKTAQRWADPTDEPTVRRIADAIVQPEAVALAAYRSGAAVVVQNRHGRGLIQRQANSAATPLDQKRYSYRVIDGRDPLGYTDNLRDDVLLDGNYHPGLRWLQGTVLTEYPDAPVALLEMFDSPRAGDLAIFAAPGWDFADGNVGGHGSLWRGDMLVPLVIAGPDLKAGVTIDTARLVDIAPTIVEMLGSTPPSLDGSSLLQQMAK